MYEYVIMFLHIHVCDMYKRLCIQKLIHTYIYVYIYENTYSYVHICDIYVVYM